MRFSFIAAESAYSRLLLRVKTRSKIIAIGERRSKENP